METGLLSHVVWKLFRHFKKKKKKIEGRTESYRCLKPLGFVTSLAKALSFAMGTYEVVNCFYSSSGGNMDSSEKPCTMCTDLHIKKL